GVREEPVLDLAALVLGAPHIEAEVGLLALALGDGADAPRIEPLLEEARPADLEVEAGVALDRDADAPPSDLLLRDRDPDALLPRLETPRPGARRVLDAVLRAQEELERSELARAAGLLGASLAPREGHVPQEHARVG